MILPHGAPGFWANRIPQPAKDGVVPVPRTMKRRQSKPVWIAPGVTTWSDKVCPFQAGFHCIMIPHDEPTEDTLKTMEMEIKVHGYLVKRAKAKLKGKTLPDRHVTVKESDLYALANAALLATERQSCGRRYMVPRTWHRENVTAKLIPILQ